jgi:hypothetical protein
MSTITASQLGTIFEKYIAESLSFFKIYIESQIKEFDSSITTIDLIVYHSNYCFLIQIKYGKKKIKANEVKAFVSDCKKLISKLNKNYIYYPIYLTRIMNTKGGIDALVELNGENIYLYNSEEDINIYTFAGNNKEFEKLLMKLYNFMVMKTGYYYCLKEWGSTDVLMSYLI